MTIVTPPSPVQVFLHQLRQAHTRYGCGALEAVAFAMALAPGTLATTLSNRGLSGFASFDPIVVSARRIN